MRRRVIALLAACFIFSAPSSSLAQTVAPFDTFNQSPVIQIHGLPSIGSATVLPVDRSQYRLTANITSNYTAKTSGNEEVLFDGETERLTFSYTQGMGENLEWGVRIPLVSHDGGSLDAFIEGWHDTFGLPQGGRDRAPHNRLIYRYSRNGVTLLNLTNATDGVGDVRVNGAWQWRKANRQNDANIALRTSLSLPTGDSGNLMGSGGVDAALWVSADRARSWFGYPGSLWGGAGILLLGEGDVLADQQRDASLFGSVGGGAKVWSNVFLKLQMDANTALYSKSSLVQISGDSIQLIMGGEIEMDKNIRIDLAVKEDPTLHASPDVVFHIGLSVNN
ncbi:MAG: DUF3187 family protein [Gammaproteobacteria bacterium]|nr:DUF3187 family protein [Gammaproteobacteria bacterium]